MLIKLQCKEEINVVVDDDVVVETMGYRKKIIGSIILQPPAVNFRCISLPTPQVGITYYGDTNYSPDWENQQVFSTSSLKSLLLLLVTIAFCCCCGFVIDLLLEMIFTMVTRILHKIGKFHMFSATLLSGDHCLC